MDPEILKPSKTDSGHIKEKAYPTAPAHYLKYKEVINTENIGKISLTQIKQLAKELSKNNIFPRIKDLSEEQVQYLIDKILFSGDTKFLDALCTIIFMCSEEGVDILERCGANFDVELQSEKVVLSYIKHPEIFGKALNYLLAKSITPYRTYHIFSSKEEIPVLQNGYFQDKTDIENNFREYFQRSNCGNFCRPRMIPQINNKDAFGFFVEHGTNEIPKISLIKDKLSFRKERNVMEDLAIYDPSLKLVLVSSRSSKHCEFYAKMIGKIFWGNENLFKEQHQLNLSFIHKAIHKENIKEILKSCCSGRVKKTQIKGIQMITNNLDNTRITYRTRRGCLTDSNRGNSISKGDIIEIELGLELLIDGKNRSRKLILKSTSVKYSLSISPYEIIHIFNQLNIK